MAAIFFVMPNPLKDIWTAPQALFSPVGGLFDKAKVLQLNLETRNAAEPDDVSKQKSGESTAEFLKNYGYSETIINQFFKPFFGGVFLEKDLATDSAFFKFLYNQFSVGDVVVPEKRYAGDSRTNRRTFVTEPNSAQHACQKHQRQNRLSGKTAKLSKPKKIVLATDAKTAAKMLGEESKTEFNGTVCLYFTSDVPLKLNGEPYLIINSNEGRIN